MKEYLKSLSIGIVSLLTVFALVFVISDWVFKSSNMKFSDKSCKCGVLTNHFYFTNYITVTNVINLDTSELTPDVSPIIGRGIPLSISTNEVESSDLPIPPTNVTSEILKRISSELSTLLEEIKSKND